MPATLSLYANPIPIYRPCFPRWAVRPKSNDTALSYGARLLAWQPSDLQSTILRHSHSAVLAQRRHIGDAFASEPALACNEVLRAAATFHLFDLTGSFEPAMARMRQLTGLELPSFRKVPPPKYTGPTPPPLSVRGLHAAHRVNYTRRVRALAPCDWRLYKLAEREPL